MRRSLVPTLLALAGTLAAGSSQADPPSPGNSTIPDHVTLVSLGPAGPDSVAGHFVVVFRDLANQPVPGVVITLDFAACTDVAIAPDQRDPRLVVNCSSRTVSAVTDVNGTASFTILGARAFGPPSGPNSLRIYGDGVMLGSLSASMFDLDGTGGVTLGDLGAWASDFFSGTNPPRSDYDDYGGVSLSDLSFWAAAYFSGRELFSAGPYCP